jgi:hypothetical protein
VASRNVREAERVTERRWRAEVGAGVRGPNQTGERKQRNAQK